MDVMLSMRAQSLYVPPSPTATTPLQSIATGSQEGWRPQTSVSVSSISSDSSYSHHTAANIHSPTTTSSRALKGLFGNRSRSPSGASLTDPNPADRAQAENSFGFMGNSLINMMRPGNASASTFTAPSTAAIPSSANGHAPGGFAGMTPILDRKIVPGTWTLEDDDTLPDSSSWTVPTAGRSAEKATRTLSLQIPLQPPPRKRWTSIGPGNPPERIRISEDDLLAKPNPTFQQGMYGNAGGNGSLSAVGIGPGGDLAGSDRASVLSTPRAPSVQSISVSLQSVSTFASAERVSPVGGSAGRPSLETKRSSRRWSRQGSLPKRMTPPAGPPPAPPVQGSSSGPQPTNGRTSLDNRSHGRSSVHSMNSEKSATGIPSFGRQSTTAGIPQQQGPPTGSLLHPNSASAHNRGASSHRTSMPPPRGPAPTIALPPAPHDPRGARRDSEPPLPMKAHASAVSSPSTTISRFRDRTFRISMMEPKPPPSSGLPPRPDETVSVASEGLPSRHLPPIPASPVPPPSKPEPLVDTKKPAFTPPRSTSLKKRLRILSAPASAPTTPIPPTLTLAASHPLRNSLQLQRNDSLSSNSRPETPVAEHIAHPKVQNDPSFIDGTVLPTPSPTSSYFPLVDVSSGIRASSRPRPIDIPLPSIDDHYPEFKSLSPPPRRTSKQLSQMEVDQAVAAARYIDTTPPGGVSRPQSILNLGEKDNVLTKSLTRRGSVVSVGIVSM